MGLNFFLVVLVIVVGVREWKFATSYCIEHTSNSEELSALNLLFEREVGYCAWRYAEMRWVDILASLAFVR